MVALSLPAVPIVDYGDDEAEMSAYREAGTARALELDNRGPIRYADDGSVHPDMLDSFARHGFYVLTGVIGADELADIEADVADIVERLPTHRGAETDGLGRPALGTGLQAANLGWTRPLADPLGGTDRNNGRHPTKMAEPTPPNEAPEHVVQVISGILQFSDACLRVSAHPDLLRIAEAVHGPDFTPFNEVLWIKAAGLGGSVAWHQDPWTHWDSPDLDGFTHGFHFMVQLYGCDAANGLWVIPGSHLGGKADIAAMAEEVGSDRLPGAVPLVCGPGDVVLTNRQAIHGSFANTSPNPRVTINFGAHRRSSILGVTSGGVHNPITEYTAEHIFERSKAISWAISARAQRFPDEIPYSYAPFADVQHDYVWNDDARAQLRDYNLRDLGI